MRPNGLAGWRNPCGDLQFLIEPCKSILCSDHPSLPNLTRYRPLTKDDIVDTLEKLIARLLELKGENPFKVRAYTNGARAWRR